VFFTIIIISSAFCQDYFNVDFYKITDGYVNYRFLLIKFAI
jgi:hypothetical protein